MEKELKKVLNLLKEEVICWIYYPKGSSAIQTDLTRDKGWESLLKHENLQWLSLISFDEVWSAFGMRLKKVKDEKKDAKLKERIVFQYLFGFYRYRNQYCPTQAKFHHRPCP